MSATETTSTEELSTNNTLPFVDRRSGSTSRGAFGERRQFSSSPNTSRPEVAELAAAIDHYKLSRRRRFITMEELYDVIAGLGYHR
jgi:hypothetical protein